MTSRTVEEELVGDDRPPRRGLSEWNEDFGIVAGITVAGERGDTDFGLAGSAPVGEVISRWHQLREDLRGFDGMVTGRQVHGNVVRDHQGTGGGWVIHDGVDGHVTDQPGLLLTVTVADCVPVFLYSGRTRRIGLLHAGWKGIARGILERGLQALVVDPQEVALHLGPAICGDCYEVGDEVFEQLKLEKRADHRVDLRAVLAARASGLGVQRITSSPWCVNHDDGFFSHRKSGPAAGRLAAYLGRRRNVG